MSAVNVIKKNKEKLQKSLVKGIKIFLKKIKTKSASMRVNGLETFPNKKKK